MGLYPTLASSIWLTAASKSWPGPHHKQTQAHQRTWGPQQNQSNKDTPNHTHTQAHSHSKF